MNDTKTKSKFQLLSGEKTTYINDKIRNHLTGIVNRIHYNIMLNITIRCLLVLPLFIFSGCGKWWSSSPASPQREIIDADRATKLILNLPETVAYAQEAEKQTGGEKTIKSSVYENPAQCEIGGRPPAWYIDVKEYSVNSIRLWNRFRVDAVTEEISVWRPKENAYIKLNIWRSRLRN